MKKYFMLYANCILVKGFNRSSICDLHKGSVQMIPNDLYNIFENGKLLNVNVLLKKIKLEEDKEIVLEYLDFLVEGNYGFFSKNKKVIDFYKDLDSEFDTPFKLSNAIIDINDSLPSYMEKALSEIDNLHVKAIEIRFFNNLTSLSELDKLHELIKKTSISHVSIILPNNNFENISIEKIANFRFSQITFYNCEIDVMDENLGTRVIFSTQNGITEKSCGIVGIKYFSSNIELFLESTNFNSCLHKKVSLDKNGFIRNCPSMPEHYGNINNTSLVNALNHPEFKKYWNVTKDIIQVCKDCEFRHICTDCRAYTERTHFEGDIDLSKPLKCGYNPYTNEWAEWSTNPLKQKAIEYYGMQELVKKDA